MTPTQWQRPLRKDQLTYKFLYMSTLTASGGNRSTNAARTDIELLRMAGLSVVAGKSNPLIRDRVAAVQALLENGKG